MWPLVPAGGCPASPRSHRPLDPVGPHTTPRPPAHSWASGADPGPAGRVPPTPCPQGPPTPTSEASPPAAWPAPERDTGLRLLRLRPVTPPSPPGRRAGQGQGQVTRMPERRPGAGPAQQSSPAGPLWPCPAPSPVRSGSASGRRSCGGIESGFLSPEAPGHAGSGGACPVPTCPVPAWSPGVWGSLATAWAHEVSARPVLSSRTQEADPWALGGPLGQAPAPSLARASQLRSPWSPPRALPVHPVGGRQARVSARSWGRIAWFLPGQNRYVSQVHSFVTHGICNPPPAPVAVFSRLSQRVSPGTTASIDDPSSARETRYDRWTVLTSPGPGRRPHGSSPFPHRSFPHTRPPPPRLSVFPGILLLGWDRETFSSDVP